MPTNVITTPINRVPRTAQYAGSISDQDWLVLSEFHRTTNRATLYGQIVLGTP